MKTTILRWFGWLVRRPSRATGGPADRAVRLSTQYQRLARALESVSHQSEPPAEPIEGGDGD